jgi:hypothetical protein
MEWWRQKIYMLEFVLVVLPATIFLFFTFFLLAGLAGSNPRFALQLFILWLGGCLGTYALWTMYVRLLNNKLVSNLKELPLILLACGIISNAVPVFYFLFTVAKLEQFIFTLLCFAPAIVAFHWIYTLKFVGSKMPIPAFERDAAKAWRPSTLR